MKTLKGRKSTITENMIELMNCIPVEFNHYFNSEEIELKSLFGLIYSISNNFNTDRVKLSLSKISKDFSKKINSGKLQSLTSQLKDRGLIERIDSTQEGTIYKILFSNNTESQHQETIMETRKQEITNQEKIQEPTASNSFYALMLKELREIKEQNQLLQEEIKTLRDDNEKFKEAFRLLNRKANILKEEIQSLKSQKEEIPTARVEQKSENTPRNAGNAVLSDEMPSDEETSTKEAEMRETTLKTPNSASIQNEDVMTELLHKAFGEGNESATQNAGNATVSDETFQDDKVTTEASEMLEMPFKTQTRSIEELEKMSLRDLTIRELIKLQSHRGSHFKSYDDIQDEIQRRREIEEKRMISNSEIPTDETETEIQQEQQSIKYVSVLPKFGSNRVTAVFRLNKEQVLKEIEYRNANGLEEDQILLARLGQLEKIEEIHGVDYPAPIENGCLPF